MARKLAATRPGALPLLGLLAALAGCSAGEGTSERATRHDADADADADLDSGLAPFDAPDPTLDVAVEAEPERLGPPYPIVLAHGFFGFEEFAGVDFATYFYGVRARLAAQGEAEVFTPAVDPFNSSTARGATLSEHVADILATTRRRKVILIGHSQGGLDARVVAHDHPDQVAAVVTLATPHRGTPLSDVILGLVPQPGLQGVVDAVVRLVGGALYDAAGNETSVMTGLRQFSTDGIAEFNRDYPDAPGVAYYSLTGRTSLSLGTAACATSTPAPFVTPYALEVDPIDALFSPLDPLFGLDPHDGLVAVKDARWGTFLGCVPADHLDEIGQLFGDGPGLGNQWNHLDFFASLVSWLRAQGY